MRYLKYAVGEIVLVVIGILIALQINDWYQERLDRRTEREYLVSMKRDLTEDTRELRVAIDGNASILEGLNETLVLLSEPRNDEVWQRDLYLHGLKYTYWFVVMEYFEEDYGHILEPLEVFDPMVPEGRYLDDDDPAVMADYYDDMLYYRTALNILNLMYRRQLGLAESLSTLIETQYGI